MTDETQRSGILYLCGTPIGNLSDASLRLRQTLESVDLIACEDTRRTKKLLSSFDIHKPIVSLHQHAERGRAHSIIELLSAGKPVAFVSDAGMPSISDPGAFLVSAAVEAGISIKVVPGPSAVTSALALSGFPADVFLFGGFPPRKTSQRQKYFREWIKAGITSVFFESPHRLIKSLRDLEAVFPQCQVCLCHEMTKVYESEFRGTVQDVINQLSATKILGEWVMVVRLEKQ